LFVGLFVCLFLLFSVSSFLTAAKVPQRHKACHDCERRIFQRAMARLIKQSMEQMSETDLLDLQAELLRIQAARAAGPTAKATPTSGKAPKATDHAATLPVNDPDDYHFFVLDGNSPAAMTDASKPRFDDTGAADSPPMSYGPSATTSSMQPSFVPMPKAKRFPAPASNAAYMMPGTAAPSPMPGMASPFHEAMPDLDLPPGVTSLTEWGRTLLESGKLENSSYLQVATQQTTYSKYILSNNRLTCPSLLDFRAFLKSHRAQHGPLGSIIFLPDSNIIRRFAE
jgi:hypothetical protein